MQFNVSLMHHMYNIFDKVTNVFQVKCSNWLVIVFLIISLSCDLKMLSIFYKWQLK